MANEHKRESFDLLDEVKIPPMKNIGMAVFFHMIAVLYVFIWQLILTS